MNEIEEYLNDLACKVKEIKYLEKNPLIVAQKHFEYGQLLMNVGKQLESLEYISYCWNALKCAKLDHIYGTLFYNVGLTYAILLDYVGDFANCEKIFLELTALNPDGFHLGDYAYFLHRRRRDFENAERMYVKAVTLFPTDSAIHLKYAGFLRHIRKNITDAENEYRKAIEANSLNADALGNYASFLHGVCRNVDEAESHYRRAVDLDDTHANNLCNYGLFLSEEKHNFEEAEKMYQRVLQLTPNHINTLYNYAVLLDTHLKRKEEAEDFYRATLDIEPRHAYALYNLAVLLEEKYFNSKDNQENTVDRSNFTEEEKLEQNKKIDEVSLLYRRAAESDSRDSSTIADYGRFVYLRGENPLQAESILLGALKINPNCDVALYYLALLQYKEKNSPEKAEGILQELLKLSPNHTSANITLSRLLIDKIKRSGEGVGALIDPKSIERVIQMYETAINSSSKENEPIIQEYLKFVSEYGSHDQKSAAIRHMTPIISKLQRIDIKTTRRASKDLSAATIGAQNSSLGKTRRKTITEVVADCFRLLNEIKDKI